MIGSSRENNCAQDEELLLRDLYQLYYERLCYYAHTFLPQMDVCRDLVQEVFVKLLIDKDLTNRIENYECYLRRMTKNAVLDYFRSRKRKPEFNELILDELLEFSCEAESIETEELAALINDAIDELSDTQKSIFKLNRFEDKSYGEIAKIYNVSPKTVEYHMSKALSGLRMALKDYVLIIACLFGTYIR